MRIIGGERRGLKLAELGKGDAAAHLRPTSDRVREAIFNLLQNSPRPDPVPGARVLDLFAGSGALGLEALSRGATHVTFVETGPPALALIRQNIDRMQASEATTVHRRDATKMDPNRAAPFTLIFLDPPYGQSLGQAALTACLSGHWIAPKAILVWEENTPQTPPKGFTLLDQRRYGETWVTLLEAPS